MDCNKQDKIIAFDTLFSNNHIQMLKILLPFVDNQTKGLLAVYIKFLELSYTMEFCKKHSLSMCNFLTPNTTGECSDSCGCQSTSSFGSSSFITLCGELLPLCNTAEKKQIEQLLNIFQSMETYREMSKTMEAMKEFMPNMGTGDNNSDFDMTTLLMNMMTPEQKEMFDLFGGNEHDK